MKACFSLISFLITGFAATSQAKTNSVAALHTTLSDTSKYFSLRVLPSDYYSSHVGFFCKKELQVQNTLKLPLRIRLGSVAYCDAIEGKNNAHP